MPRSLTCVCCYNKVEYKKSGKKFIVDRNVIHLVPIKTSPSKVATFWNKFYPSKPNMPSTFMCSKCRCRFKYFKNKGWSDIEIAKNLYPNITAKTKRNSECPLLYNKLCIFCSIGTNTNKIVDRGQSIDITRADIFKYILESECC